MRYDAVIFDLRGTLIDWLPADDYERFYAETARLLGVPCAEYRRAWNACMRDRDSGKLGSIENAIRHVSSLVGAKPDAEAIKKAVALRLDITRRNVEPRAGVLETLISLKSSGHRLGLISDCYFEVPMVWPDTRFAEVFDAAVFSCDAGVCKPDPSIYLRACALLDVTPGRCLYVGDGGSNELTGARAVGMHPVLIRVGYDNNGDLHRPDTRNWDGPVISSIPDVLALVEGGNRRI